MCHSASVHWQLSCCGMCWIEIDIRANAILAPFPRHLCIDSLVQDCSNSIANALKLHCRYAQSHYFQTSNIRDTLVDKKFVDQSDVVGSSPVGAAPTASSFSTSHLVSMDLTKITARQDENHLSYGIWWAYIKDFTVYIICFFAVGCKKIRYLRHG